MGTQTILLSLAVLIIDNTDTCVGEEERELHNFIDFVVDVSHYHPSNPSTASYQLIMQNVYQESVKQNCTITASNFLDMWLQNQIQKKNFSGTLDCFYTSILNKNLTQKLQNATNFVKTVCESIGLKRKEAILKQERQPSILVIGGGPTGLGNAIEAFASGGNVYEKRNNYTRSLWLDLMPPPWSQVHAVLTNWGWTYQRVEAKLYTNPDVWTVRIQILERFLAKVASMVGVKLHYKYNFISLCDSTHAAILPSSVLGNKNTVCQQSESIVKFDVIIGSDGSSSNVRKFAEVDYAVAETFPILGETRTVPGIRQVTFIANFDPWKSNNGKCPELQVDSSGEVLSPYYPSFFFDGVSSVWKRFYLGHCQLQVLFHKSIGNKIWDTYSHHSPHLNSSNLDFDWEDQAIPWDLFLKIINILVKNPYKNKGDLQQDLLRKPNGEYDVQLFPVIIRKAGSLTKVLSNLERTENNAIEELPDVHGIMVLVGDASVTAHYRLGIGINNAFSSFNEVGELVRKLGSVSNDCWHQNQEIKVKCADIIKNIVLEREQQAQARVEKLINFQLTAMYYESYCDFVASYDLDSDMSTPPGVFKRDRKKKTFDEILDRKTLTKNCH